jgi:hypothetical protein
MLLTNRWTMLLTIAAAASALDLAATGFRGSSDQACAVPASCPGKIQLAAAAAQPEDW